MPEPGPKDISRLKMDLCKLLKWKLDDSTGRESESMLSGVAVNVRMSCIWACGGAQLPVRL